MNNDLFIFLRKRESLTKLNSYLHAGFEGKVSYS